MAHDFLQIVPSVLHIDVSRILDRVVLIDLENVTNMASPTQLIRDQLRLNRPASHRWRIIADLQDFRLVPQLRSRVNSARLQFGIPNALNALRIADFHSRRPRDASLWHRWQAIENKAF